MALFERIRTCGLVGGSVLQGMCFKVSEAQAKTSGSLFLPAAYWPRCRTLNYMTSIMSTYTPPCFLTCQIMNEASQQVSQPQIIFSFMRVSMVMASLHSDRTQIFGYVKAGKHHCPSDCSPRTGCYETLAENRKDIPSNFILKER